MLQFDFREFSVRFRLIVVATALLLPAYSTQGQSTLFSTSVASLAEKDFGIVTDRPDFTEASSTVGKDYFQLESGYTYSIGPDRKTSGHSFPEILLRAGAWKDWFEIRIGINFANVPQPLLNNVGIEDIYLGTKIGLFPQSGVVPELAIIAQCTLPTGSSGLNSDSILPGTNLLYGWEVNERVSTGGSTQVNFCVDERTQEHFDQWAQSWTVGYSVTDNVGVYSEWFMLSPHGATTANTQHYFNGGLTIQPNPMLQFDIRAGRGLNEASDSYFVGAGVSMKFSRLCE